MIGERPPSATARKRARKQSARTSRKSRRTRRLERRAEQRRRRARAHLDHVLGRTDTRSPARHPRHQHILPESLGRWVLPGAFAAALVAGALLAKPLGVMAAQWGSPEPVVIEGVAVQGMVRLSAAEVARTIDFANGQAVDRVDTEELAEALEAHAWVAAARLALLPGGSLVVRIEERQPVATLRSSPEGEDFLVDASGSVFAPAAGEITEGLFALQRSGAPTALDPKANAELSRAARLAEGIAARNWSELAGATLRLPEPEKHEGWVLRSANGELLVVLGNETDNEIEARLDRLDALLQADLWAGPAVGRIDLRFEERAILHASVEL